MIEYYGALDLPDIHYIFDNEYNCPFRHVRCGEVDWCSYKHFLINRRHWIDETYCRFDETCPLRKEREEPRPGEILR